jgi:hypothetical protein
MQIAKCKLQIEQPDVGVRRHRNGEPAEEFAFYNLHFAICNFPTEAKE